MTSDDNPSLESNCCLLTTASAPAAILRTSADSRGWWGDSVGGNDAVCGSLSLAPFSSGSGGGVVITGTGEGIDADASDSFHIVVVVSVAEVGVDDNATGDGVTTLDGT